MRVCGNCHSEVPDGSTTCVRCGSEMPRGFFASLGSLFRRASPPTPPPASPPPRSAAPSVAPSSGEPFAFEVEDVFTITGRGMVTTGHVTRGRIVIGDEVSFRSPKGDLVQLRITGIEGLGKLLKEANEGELVGLLLSKTVSFDVLPRGTRFERA